MMEVSHTLNEPLGCAIYALSYGLTVNEQRSRQWLQSFFFSARFSPALSLSSSLNKKKHRWWICMPLDALQMLLKVQLNVVYICCLSRDELRTMCFLPMCRVGFLIVYGDDFPEKCIMKRMLARIIRQSCDENTLWQDAPFSA